MPRLQRPRVNSTLWAWGRNNNGQLGDGSTTNRSSPVQIGSLTDWTTLRVSTFHNFAVRSNGTLWTWGRSNQGQIGDGDNVDRSSPVQIGSLTTWRFGSPGSLHSAGLRADGTIWMWGDGAVGKGGQISNLTDRSSPVQVGSLTTWIDISAGTDHTLALQSNGTLWAWGEGSTGELGQGTSAVDRSSPVQIGTAASNTWIAISARDSHSLALRSNGTLWAWGEGSTGELGQGTSAVDRSSPVQIGSLTTWVAVAAGDASSHAIKADGTLWSWGSNGSGQLGDGSATNRSSPVQVGSLTTWVDITAGTNHTLALQSNGTLWAWGFNPYGQLGDGSATNRSSPVQVGSLTTWVAVGGGTSHSIALRRG